MLTLALYALGIATALFIAKYNASYKLFWVLFTALTFSFAVTKMAINLSSKQSNSKNAQVMPTQDAIVTPSTFMCFLAGASLNAPKKETSEPVSQALNIILGNISVALTSVANNNRDQPVHMLPNPPNTS